MLDIVKKALAYGAIAAVGFGLLKLSTRLPVVGPWVAKLGV